MDGDNRVSEATVSVCVPARNAEPWLAETIESVLAQTHDRWELFIVDNHSSDRTAEIAASYQAMDERITVVSNRQVLAIGDNWNRAASLGRAPYLKVLCADDVLHPDGLARQVEVLDREPDVVLVGGRRHLIDDRGAVVVRDRGLLGLVGHHRGPAVVERVVRSGMNPLGPVAALLFRRRAFRAAGGFDGRWHFPLDLDLSLRVLHHGDFVGLDHVVASFRVSPEAASSIVRGQGAEHRALLHAVAADPGWAIRRSALRRGLALTWAESVRRRLLVGAVNSDRPLVRRLPGLVLRPRTSGSWPPPGSGNHSAPIGVVPDGGGTRPGGGHRDPMAC